MTSQPVAPVRPPLSRGARLALVALVASGLPIGAAIVYFSWWGPVSWFGAALMSFSPMVAALMYGRFFHKDDMRPANRRYRARQTAITIVYFFVIMGATWLYNQGLTDGPIGYVVAIAPALPIVGIFVAMARYYQEETDEVLRTILLTSVVWSGGLTLCEATVWGFLETFGKVPNVWMWAVPIAFFGQLAITGPLASRRFK